MTTTVLNDPTHECVLPDPGEHPSGTWIRCDAERLQNGYLKPCGRQWLRSATFWRGTPEWRSYSYGGWG
jgi:hypothetical protein